MLNRPEEDLARQNNTVDLTDDDPAELTVQATKRCSACRAPRTATNPLCTCACNAALYCDEACQHAHWREHEPEHRRWRPANRPRQHQQARPMHTNQRHTTGQQPAKEPDTAAADAGQFKGPTTGAAVHVLNGDAPDDDGAAIAPVVDGDSDDIVAKSLSEQPPPSQPSQPSRPSQPLVGWQQPPPQPAAAVSSLPAPAVQPIIRDVLSDPRLGPALQDIHPNPAASHLAASSAAMLQLDAALAPTQRRPLFEWEPLPSQSVEWSVFGDGAYDASIHTASSTADSLASLSLVPASLVPAISRAAAAAAAAATARSGTKRKKTSATAAAALARTRELNWNRTNMYTKRNSRNVERSYCYCGEDKQGPEDHCVQCSACENWFHVSCTQAVPKSHDEFLPFQLNCELRMISNCLPLMRLLARLACAAALRCFLTSDHGSLARSLLDPQTSSRARTATALLPAIRRRCRRQSRQRPRRVSVLRSLFGRRQ